MVTKPSRAMVNLQEICLHAMTKRRYPKAMAFSSQFTISLSNFSRQYHLCVGIYLYIITQNALIQIRSFRGKWEERRRLQWESYSEKLN